MGRSSPPFLYRQANSTFHGPTDRPFNPKAVTEASWTREEPKPQPKGPLVNLNRHPDSWSSAPDIKPQWEPMSPSTKGRVKYGRLVQLVLRLAQLLGALGSLFCVIVITNVQTTVSWIIRVGPAVAILHTLYGAYHLCRSPVTRPPGSQASYMLFASTVDACLIPFFAFAAFMGYGQYTTDTYDWGTLLDNSDGNMPSLIAQTLFLLSVINGGLHLISLGISIFLAAIFRQITRLPPDMNPLEDNLTARPLKRKKKPEITEKHTSQHSVDSILSSVEDPLIGPPRTMPFMHTRQNSSFDRSSYAFSEISNEKRNSKMSFHLPLVSNMEPSSPQFSASDQPVRPKSFITQTSAFRNIDSFSAQPETVADRIGDVQLEQPVAEHPGQAHLLSDPSDNWIAYPSRTPSPVLDGAAKNENLARREASSVYSKRSNTTTSSYSGVKDWVGSAQKFGRDIGNVLPEDIRGEYESLTMNEYYGNEDMHSVPKIGGFYDELEHDLGTHRIEIFTDHNDNDDLSDNDDQDMESLRPNPLTMNPPTPRPLMDEYIEDHVKTSRPVLTDIPNLEYGQASLVPPPIENPLKKGRFYGELQSDSGLSIPRGVSGQDEEYTRPKEPSRAKSFIRRKSEKKRKPPIPAVAPKEEPPVDPPTVATHESDRKGRVVSNSGADITARNTLGAGSALSYGNYIAGLGVGRRRDVSGKLAEEGRSAVFSSPSDEQPARPGSDMENTTPIRAAGWARFAGL
ncbi:hypothetical protein ASPZODRAFT_132109 [Penicilliopsis zonata CBS 506.65]|uniref:Uncharacterized protein n=1 Tax=Penicilliopsis zonata CBS 506.65 TaxID=1073090 RepID=A0A1L9SJ54_9EURO|nr:hypothetical protein ASPZODRAFT_132109 [Penicilliopsis zonata CBS 506.65]OJJ47156.1 hypothetical protein ASPZODRAFT_132109 [Penicilliopsis zonata CBS 506.65]